ncbi:MAG TPA: hypothetical protein VGI73_16705 [Solirubrobacterales bacterium]
MDAAAVARGAEFADRAAFTVRRLQREDVGEEGNRAVRGAERVVGLGGGGRGAGREEKEGEEDGALQWCSITRSTMWYSFASSALMK